MDEGADVRMNLMEALDMRVIQQAEGYVEMTMPVVDKVKQPFGYLHGGASIALGETACSLGAASMVDTAVSIPMGLEMNANHVGSVQSGTVTAKATCIHAGRSTQVWDIRITDKDDRLITVMRGTMMIKHK